MMRLSPILTRRAALRLIGSVPVVAGLATPLAGAAPYDARLRALLADIPLPVRPSELSLVRFEEKTKRGQAIMKAVVRLNWPPGMRQRGFDANANDPELAFGILVGKIEAYFVSVG